MNGSSWQRRRGISSIIATLILIAIAVAGAALVYSVVLHAGLNFSSGPGMEITQATVTPIAGGQAVLSLSVTDTGGTPELASVAVYSGGQLLGYYSVAGLSTYGYIATSQPAYAPIDPVPTSAIQPGAWAGDWPSSLAWDYGTPSYQGNTYLGMVCQPFPAPFSFLNNANVPCGQEWYGYEAMGSILIPASGSYTFSIETDDGMEVWISGPSTGGQWQPVFGGNAWHGQGATEYQQTIALQPGWYQVAAVWWNYCGPGVSAFTVSGPAQPIETIAPGQGLSGQWVIPYPLQPGQTVTLVAEAQTPTGQTAASTTTVVVG